MAAEAAPAIIMVAPNGARHTKADHPALPITAGEIAEAAAACHAAGAAMLHLHVRNADGGHSLAPEFYRAAIAAVEREVGPSMIVQVTTEAVGLYEAAEQMAVVRELTPRSVSLALRELVPDDADVAEAAAFLAWLRRERIAPQFILYEPGEVRRLIALKRRGVIPQAEPWLLFVLGRYAAPGGAVAPIELLPFLAASAGSGPWSLCAFGNQEAACMMTAAALGGHPRVGFENSLLRPDGTMARDNAEQVRRTVEGCALIGRPVADSDATHEFLTRAAA